jgi:hypothetical protein
MGVNGGASPFWAEQQQVDQIFLKSIASAESRTCGKAAPSLWWRPGGRVDVEVVDVGDDVDLLSPPIHGGDLGVGRPWAAPDAAK